MKFTIKNIALLLVIIGIILTIIGGWIDYKDNNYKISKEHLWNDGTYLTLLAIFIILYKYY